MILLVASFARALTLEEAVARAAEVDPTAIIAELAWKRSQLSAAESWVGLGPSPGVSATRLWSTGAVSDRVTFDAQIASLSVPDWFLAGQASAYVGAARWTSSATRLDAQYAAAALYESVIAAQGALDAAHETQGFAESTVRASKARVAAGLESELIGRSAEISLLDAQANTELAEAGVTIASARLQRALQMAIGALEPPTRFALPTDTAASPWLRASAAAVTAAKLGHNAAIAGWLPAGGISASTPLFQTDWQFALTGTWQFDGVVGPFLRERETALDVRIAGTQYDALQRDLDLGLVEARANASAAHRVAEAARARESLAKESVKVGQTRLEVGLASTLEVLRLQDDAAAATFGRVQAELNEALAVLEARRVAGIEW